MSKMTDENKAESKKKETEIKEVIRKMVSAGIPITSAEVERQSGLSHSFVYKPQIQKFIKEQKEKQKKGNLRVDIELQNSIYHKNLMASYIFAYSLLDEQEEFLKTAIAELKDRKKPFGAAQKPESIINFLSMILSDETDPAKISSLLDKFQASYSETIPDWKEQLAGLLTECPALGILKNNY